MILCNTYEVKLKKIYNQILFLHAAYNNTFVFLGMLTPRKDGVVHVDSKGNILFEKQFDDPMLTMAMMSDREAIFVNSRKNMILVLDL